LPAPEKDQFRVETVSFKQAGVFRDPDMDLVGGDRRIADLDLFELLALGGADRQEQPDSGDGEKVAR